MLAKTEKLLRVRNAQGQKVDVVREHYVREDIPCRSSVCFVCTKFPGGDPRLPSDANHYIIPDVEVAKHYMEMLELPCISGVIWPQTVTKVVQQRCGRRHYRRLCKLVSDPQHLSTVFSNEHHIDCWLLPEQGEKEAHWQSRLIHRAACYLHRHWERQFPIVILSNSEEFAEEFGAREIGVHVLSVVDYVNTFWPDEVELQDLVESLGAVWADNGSVERAHQKEFAEHLAPEVLSSGIISGKFFQGVLFVNKYRAQQEAFAWQTTNVGGKTVQTKVLISGRAARNRAVHGDTVAVRLLPRDQWDGYSYALSEIEDDGDGVNSKDMTSAVPTGQVVGILQRNWRDIVATLPQDEDMSSSASKGQKILVVPVDRCFPKIRISTRQAQRLRTQRVVVRIDSWESNSLYPNGHFVRSLGTCGELETEMAAILVEKEIIVGRFTAAQMNELPVNTADNPWSMDPEEIARRKDLRKSHLIFSIDPKGCEDVDDTLSVRQFDNGHFELGVHIADVSHFVKPGSFLDAEARARATTVYMADRRFDMLPEVLSADLCSLKSGVPRYAVSVLWKFDKSLKVIKTWFGRTVIHSRYQLFYEAAQEILDGADDQRVKSLVEELCDVDGDDLRQRVKALREAVQMLTRIASGLRERRDTDGAVELEGLEVRVQLSADKHTIDDLIPRQPLQVHEVVAECMIFANSHVAQRIATVYPQQALLRRHPSPRQDSFLSLVNCAKAKNFTIATESNASLAKSLNACVDPNDPQVNKLLRSLAVKAMMMAVYFSTGLLAANETTDHYGLALQHYTHFTSPIRRYADVIVHRLLLAAQGDKDEERKLLSCTDVGEVAEHINKKHTAAKEAQEKSVKLFQTLYFQSLPEDSELRIAEGIVYALRANGFLVYVPRFGLKGPVYLRNKNGLVAQPALEENGAAVVFGPGRFELHQHDVTVSNATGRQTYRLFDHFQVKIELIYSSYHPSALHFHLLSCSPLNIAERKEQSTHLDVVKAVSASSAPSVPTYPQLQRQKSQTSRDSLYWLFQRFHLMALQEN